MGGDFDDEISRELEDSEDDEEESGCSGAAAEAYEKQAKPRRQVEPDDDPINGPEALAVINDPKKGPALEGACSRIMREGRADDASVSKIVGRMSADERSALHDFLEARIKQGLPAGKSDDTADSAMRKICFNRSLDLIRDMTVQEARALQALLKPKK